MSRWGCSWAAICAFALQPKQGSIAKQGLQTVDQFLDTNQESTKVFGWTQMTPLVSQQVKAATVELPQVFLYMYDITTTAYQKPVEKRFLGYTSRSCAATLDFVRRWNNCNHFSDMLCVFLLDKHIPNEVLNQPQHVKGSSASPLSKSVLAILAIPTEVMRHCYVPGFGGLPVRYHDMVAGEDLGFRQLSCPVPKTLNVVFHRAGFPILPRNYGQPKSYQTPALSTQFFNLLHSVSAMGSFTGPQQRSQGILMPQLEPRIREVVPLDPKLVEVTLESLMDMQRTVDHGIEGILELHEAMLLLREQAARYSLLQGRRPQPQGVCSSWPACEVNEELGKLRSDRAEFWYALHETSEEAVHFLRQELCDDQKKTAEAFSELALRLKAAGQGQGRDQLGEAGGSLELQEARSSLHKKQQRWTKQVAGVGDVHFAGHAPVSADAQKLLESSREAAVECKARQIIYPMLEPPDPRQTYEALCRWADCWFFESGALNALEAAAFCPPMASISQQRIPLNLCLRVPGLHGAVREADLQPEASGNL
ncbi:hypothetical protein AK812_SmicGene40097 [Symbiodinium microadriaticum]|uniref:Uncharacterized protein n=1 Tax=Symbiodinium microadriaticum TaxID=2951 RepID=A0A1Q9C9U1_SYMMI|nr:hypothetical protein AK812_SmicGene40097 [Symbiodinium microadriaticum]